MISTLYNALQTLQAVKLAYWAKVRWEPDLGSMEDDEWEEILDNYKMVTPRISDRLTQLYMLHRAGLQCVYPATNRYTVHCVLLVDNNREHLLLFITYLSPITYYGLVPLCRCFEPR